MEEQLGHAAILDAILAAQEQATEAGDPTEADAIKDILSELADDPEALAELMAGIGEGDDDGE